MYYDLRYNIGGHFMQVRQRALREEVAENADPAIVPLVEQALLFGKVEDLDVLLGWISEEDGFSKGFCRDVEVLRHYRAYYGQNMDAFSEQDRKIVVQRDADWTMYLIKKLYQRFFGEDAEPSSNSIA